MINIKKFTVLEDDFEDMADSKGDYLIPLDFNTIFPFLKRKCSAYYKAEANDFDGVIMIFEEIAEGNQNKDLLILMKIRDFKDTDKLSKIGWKIAQMMGKDSLVAWSAKSFSKSPNPPKQKEIYSHKFMFYFYNRPRAKLRARHDLGSRIKNGRRF